jgi:hypothetical protein
LAVLSARVGEALARAVGRDEVLEDVEAFAEIRVIGVSMMEPSGLRHQAAHAGELADLGRGTARAGIGHHEDGIERRSA